MTTFACDQHRPQRIADLYDQAESRKAEGSYAEAQKLFHAALAALMPDRADSDPLTIVARERRDPHA